MDKIAIVNRTNLKNFGSVLQVYALCQAVKNLGYESEVVWTSGNLSKHFDIRIIKIVNIFIKIIKYPYLICDFIKTLRSIKKKEINEVDSRLFDDFVKNNIQEKNYKYNKLNDISRGNEYKKFICGSDQIWCSTSLYVDPMMYLRFAPQNKRIAYAPSLGRDYIPKYNQRIMKKYIEEIPFVSIRENKGKELIKELTGLDVPVLLDPTLLIEKNHWLTLSNKVNIEKKYLLCYFLDFPNRTIIDKINDFAKENHLSIIQLGKKINNDAFVKINAGPKEFLYLVNNSEMIITDSYHGVLFSIIFNKLFWSIERNYEQYDQSTRQKSILLQLNLFDRYVISEFNISYKSINYMIVNKILQENRDYSYKFLFDAIKG